MDDAGNLHSGADLTRGVRRVYTTDFWTGTLGDTMTAGNLTLAAGLRYDLQRGKNLPSSAFANVLFADPCTDCGYGGAGSLPGLPAVRCHGSDTGSSSTRTGSPGRRSRTRSGRNKSTLLRASYARYADQLGYVTYRLSGVPDVNGY